MSRYPRENGSTFFGIVLVATHLIALLAGYHLALNGYSIKVNQPVTRAR